MIEKLKGLVRKSVSTI